MANRTVFVDLGDVHGPLEVGDAATNAAGVLFALQGDATGILSAYPTLAAAIADTANLVTGQFVMIDGGDSASTGFAAADKGTWKIVSSNGAALGDYTKVHDGANRASEIEVLDAGNFYAGITAEAALQEIGTKQVFYKLASTALAGVSVTGGSSTAFDTALKALVIDSGSATDALGAGTSTAPGVIQNAAYAYQIPIRAAASRDVIDDGANNEVYGRLSVASGDYTVTFFSYVAGVETAYAFASALSIDLGYVLVSQDFMKLPAHAGVVQGEFFGDQAGAVGTITDNMIVTNNPSFTGLLVGKNTQEAVNNQTDLLGKTGTGEGAFLVKIEDAAGKFTSTNVEGALLEAVTAAGNKVRAYATRAAAEAAAGVSPFALTEFVIVAGANPDEAERGVYQITSGNGASAGDYTKVLDISHTAAEILIADAGNKYTGTTIEVALAEIIAAVGGTSTSARAYSSNIYVTDNDDLVTAIGKLDAALAAKLTDRVTSKAFTAGEALPTTTNGPLLVSSNGAAFGAIKTVAGAVGPKVEVLGFAVGADYTNGQSINQGDATVTSGICQGFTGLIAGKTYYANPAAPGGITDSVPAGIGEWIVAVGVAVSSTVMLVRVGEPNEIVPALPALQAAIHVKHTGSAAGGLGENLYAVGLNSIWIDNDTAVQNPTKSAVNRRTVYVCKVAWVGAGLALTSADISANFIAIGVQG
jgi:hypothetical protein